jgi:predicted DNA-binding protein (MmcQ/YjbR family)
MRRSDSVLSRLRKICLALPGTKETLTWGTPHFRVGEKIFCGYGEEKGVPAIGFKLERDHATLIVSDPRFRPAPYVGRHGWVSMDASSIDDWNRVRGLIHESYGLIAGGRAKSRRPGRRRPRG